jgi:hypothetical protein
VYGVGVAPFHTHIHIHTFHFDNPRITKEPEQLLTYVKLSHAHIHITSDSMIPSNYLTATETLALIAKGKVSAGQIIEDHRKRNEERDPVVRAWVTTNFDAAVKRTEETVGLPLHGVVIGVKDNISKLSYQAN